MVCRNPNFVKFKASYLFVEIANRKKAFCQANPDAKLISLGIGDTTEPIPDSVAQGFLKKAEDLSIPGKYSGYPQYNGSEDLRKLYDEMMSLYCSHSQSQYSLHLHFLYLHPLHTSQNR